MARTAPPPKIPNREKSSREHLFPTEVAAMISAAKKVGRHGLRDSTLILMANPSWFEGIGVSSFTLGTSRLY